MLYGARQRIWDQAENRRHAQKALLELLVERAGMSAAPAQPPTAQRPADAPARSRRRARSAATSWSCAIDSLAFGGEGVARLGDGGYVVFVAGADPRRPRARGRVQAQAQLRARAHGRGARAEPRADRAAGRPPGRALAGAPLRAPARDQAASRSRTRCARIGRLDGLRAGGDRARRWNSGATATSSSTRSATAATERRARVRLSRARRRQPGDADRGLPARLRARQPRARGSRCAGAAQQGLCGLGSRPRRGGRAAARRGAGERARRERAGPAPDGRARLRNLVVREGRRSGKLQIRLVTTDGELDAARSPPRSRAALGEQPVSGVLWTRSRSARRDDRRAARPSSCGARPSCPSASASSTCASPPRRSSRPTPRWPSCCTGSSPSTPALRGLGARVRPLLRDRHDRADARPARGRAVGDRARRAGRRRRDRGGAAQRGRRTPTSSPATPAWRCPS